MSSFCDILPSLAHRKSNIPRNDRGAIAPDPIRMAYVDLVADAFIYLRSCVDQKSSNKRELHDIADALHNITGILGDYGAWIDDVKYREIYLRGFDAQWAKDGYGMERFVEERVAYYSERDENGA